MNVTIHSQMTWPHLYIPSSSVPPLFSPFRHPLSLFLSLSASLSAMSDDKWVDVALSDDSLVVDLLLRLNRSPLVNPLSPPLRLDWSIRQPRSKPILPRQASDSAGKNSDEAARASPTTPLTWSSGGGATSVSGGFVDAVRSKVGFGFGFCFRVLFFSENSVSPFKRRKCPSVEHISVFFFRRRLSNVCTLFF